MIIPILPRLALLLGCVNAFVAPKYATLAVNLRGQRYDTFLNAKGFGKPNVPKTDGISTSKSSNEPLAEAQSPSPAPSPSLDSPPPPQKTGGQLALENLRRQEAERRDAELRDIRNLREVDAELRESPGAAAIPEKVAMRMGSRMLPFVGVPLFGGMGTFVAFWYLAKYKDYEFQPALVAFSTIAFLVIGLLGITYSVMSASWDEDREGSFLGFDEFQKNLRNIQDGLSRSRENQLIRDKMGAVPEQQLEEAIQDLNKRDAKKAEPTSFEEKLDKELQ